MAERITLDENGEANHQSIINTGGGVRSSLDYEGPGVTVQSGIGTRTVQSQADLNDTDVIAIQGMELQVKQARELGLLSEVFPDEDLSAHAASTAVEKQAAAETTPKSNTGNQTYDAAVDGLNAALDAGDITFEEASGYDTAVAQVAHAGLSVDHVAETLDGIEDGTVDPDAVPADVQSILRNAETQVTTSATQSILAEIGQEGFDYLQAAAAQNPGVNRALRTYAIDRASGRAGGVTWAEFARHIADELGQ